MGRAVALVELTGDLHNTAMLKVVCQELDSNIRVRNAKQIAAIVHQALRRFRADAIQCEIGAACGPQNRKIFRNSR